MNFLQKIFKSQREKDLEMFISELKADKIKLSDELEEYKTKFFNMLEEKNNIKPGAINQKLTKKEKYVYDTFLKDTNMTKKQLAKTCKIKVSSLTVYQSRIKNKGYNINFN